MWIVITNNGHKKVKAIEAWKSDDKRTLFYKTEDGKLHKVDYPFVLEVEKKEDPNVRYFKR